MFRGGVLGDPPSPKVPGGVLVPPGGIRVGSGGLGAGLVFRIHVGGWYPGVSLLPVCVPGGVLVSPGEIFYGGS